MPKANHITPDQYRVMVRTEDLSTFRVVVRESDLSISCQGDLSRQSLNLVHDVRRQIESYIKRFPDFATSLHPMAAHPLAPSPIKLMCEAAAKTGVGPMAAVAGAVAEYVGRGLMAASPEIIVENGGDIFLRSENVREIFILAESSSIGGLTLALPPSPKPRGICTSSGKLGHSLSFGAADSVTTLSRSAVLADAAATAIANRVRSSEDIEPAVQMARQLGLDGVVILVQEHIGAWGDLELVG